MEVDSLLSTDLEDEIPLTESPYDTAIDSTLSKRKAVENNSQNHQKRLQVDNSDEGGMFFIAAMKTKVGIVNNTKEILKKTSQLNRAINIQEDLIWSNKNDNNQIVPKKVYNMHNIDEHGIEGKSKQTESDEEWKQISMKIKGSHIRKKQVYTNDFKPSRIQR